MKQEIHLLRARERFYRRERRSIPLARDFVHQALVEWGVGERTDEVLLCVSELTTNALQHGVPPGRGFRLHLWVTDEGTLRLEVHDSGAGHPRVRAVPEDASDGESGRGLLLVETLADRWGVGRRNPGKTVWCEFEVRGYS
ncbi:ATP-binding protein [Streptomyces sp. MST-110588]|uniref:ATP-binding protein n=1 Tax=Streptomyces sp. MST-110588 TaxID=2833628 RepID=UPI001F5D83BE|nr:ATP-binding protein [Streptomyces sp. MST-110588]UNO41757.1 ATP-binding protein [Streptomyces sp. MST-110588]